MVPPASDGVIDIAFVRRALQQPLPGASAQLRMCTRPRVAVALPEGQKYRDAGVLVLLYPRAGILTLVLTRRADNLASHGGQISFPGGEREPGDSSLAETALRETREELGLAPDGLELLGCLTPLEIPVSGFRVHPWVAYLSVTPSFRPDPREVAELLEVPLSHFLDPASAGEEMRVIRGHEVDVPFYRVGPHKVWGATAMVLSEIVALLTK